MASPDAAAPERAKRPFWMHQIAEYLLGAVLVAQGLQSPTPVVPAIVGGLVIVNVAIVRGPLSAFDVVSRRMHRLLDLVVIGIVVVAAVQPWISLESVTRMLMLVVAAVMAFIWWQSSFAEKPKKPAKGAARAVSSGTSAASAPERATTSAAASTGDRSTDMGRKAGRAAAAGVLAARRLKSNRKS